MTSVDLSTFLGPLNALYTDSTGRPIHVNTDLSGKYLYTLHFVRDDVHLYPSLSISRWSFIELSELRQRVVNKIVQASKRLQEGSNPGSHA